MGNKRIYYAIEQVGVAPLGLTAFTGAHVIHGVQSVGINTKFNLEQVFELGQVSLYQDVETVPDVEITLEKGLDGFPLIGHLATRGATDPSLVGRANTQNQFAMSIFSDNQTSASGTPISTVFCSGVYLSSWNFTFPVEGISTEQATLVGNNKKWGAAGITFTGFATNTDQPSGTPGAVGWGVSRRWNFVWEPQAASGAGLTTYSLLPTDIEGVSGSGVNTADALGNRAVHVQSIRTGVNLARDQFHELGRRACYYRYVNFPVEVRTDIEIMGLTGDQVNALETGVNADGSNVNYQTINIKVQEGTYIQLGTRNKLQGVTYGGGNATGRGGNVTETYNYLTYNDFIVTHPADPSGFLPY